MAWYDKLLTTIDDAKSMPMMKIVFRSFDPVNAEFVEGLREKIPSLDDDYARFLSITDGASLWMYEFFGSGASRMPALGDLESRWKKNIEKLGVLPIGEDPSGNCIGIRENGEIVQFDYRAETDADCEVLAKSFAELLDVVLMGDGFYSLFDIPAADVEENEWLGYLKQKGWISM